MPVEVDGPFGLLGAGVSIALFATRHMWVVQRLVISDLEASVIPIARTPMMFHWKHAALQKV